MDARIQKALDGELSRGALSREEALRLDRAERQLDQIVASVPEEPVPDLTAAVMARLEGGTERHKSLIEKILTPRPVILMWRPAYALGMVAALAAVVFATTRSITELPPSTSATQVLVQFRLDAPAARHVVLAGDFTDWKPTYALRRSEPGVWTVVVPLNPGVHDYAFVVDGHRWVADPMAPAVADGFGGMNSRLAVLAPDGARGI